MPFTPYHFGPALLLGVTLRRWFHWPTLIVTSLVIDVEPLLALTVLRGYPVHGYLHTFLGSFVGGSLVGLLMHSIDGPFKRIYHGLALVERDLGLKNYLTAGVIGWSVHILYDAPLYYEMMPLYPLQGNPFYESLPYSLLHALNVAFLCAGVAVYLVNTFIVTSSRCGARYALMQVGLLLIAAASLPLLTLDVSMFFLAIAMIMNGIIAFHVSLLKIVKQWRARIMLSMTLTLTAIIALLVTAILPLPFPEADFKALLSSLLHLPAALLVVLWVGVLAGLILLRRPLSEVYDGVAPRLILMLILGWALTPIIVGVLVFWAALVLMAARISEARALNNKLL